MPSPEPGFAAPDPNSASGGLRSTLQKMPGIKLIAGLAEPAGAVRYRAFISYSHRDEKIARWLHRRIETYRVPRAMIGTEAAHGIVPRRLSPIFRDEDELPGAAELGPELEAALQASAAMIVVCSPAAAASVWVNREIRHFKQLHPDRPVLAVIAAGTPGGIDECFPDALRLVADPEGELRHDPTFEPLAPDLQKQDGQIVRLKLVAGLLGVRYADLYQRDRRRARRLAAGAGTAGLILIALLSALSIAAVTSARIAVRERNAARLAEARAEHNADVAERRAWLAQVAATEIRRESDLLKSRKACR